MSCSAEVHAELLLRSYDLRPPCPWSAPSVSQVSILMNPWAGLCTHTLNSLQVNPVLTPKQPCPRRRISGS